LAFCLKKEKIFLKNLKNFPQAVEIVENLGDTTYSLWKTQYPRPFPLLDKHFK
jgi:hypothetical protein